MLHTIASTLIGLLGLSLMAGLRLLVSPRFHRTIQRKLRDNTVDEMERNLARYEQHAARDTPTQTTHR